MAELNFESEELDKVHNDMVFLKSGVDSLLLGAYEKADEIGNNLENSSQLRPSLNKIMETINTLKQSIDANMEKAITFLKEQLQQYEIDTDVAVQKIDEAIAYIESFTKNITISNA